LTTQKTLKRRLRRIQIAANRQLVERQVAEEKAAEEAALANEGVRAAEIRRWRAWMAQNRPNGLDL
jgi:aminoglycoside phosphotransferase (APT) family kinase protein